MTDKTFEVGDRVVWRSGAAGKIGEKTGAIARIVRPGEVPDDIRKPGTSRKHVSYVVRADNGSAYWPHVQHLQHDGSMAAVTLSPDDRKLLDWLRGQLGGCGCDHVFPLLDRLAAGVTPSAAPRAPLKLEALDEQAREHVEVLLHIVGRLTDPAADRRSKLADAILSALRALSEGNNVTARHRKELELYANASWSIGGDILVEKGPAFLAAVHALIAVINKP